jgi:ABC-2 type transport system permease protein
MRWWHLLAKDLLQMVKDWKSAIFLLAMPLAFTLFFGFVTGGDFRAAAVRIGWLDRDLRTREPATGAALRDLVASAPSVQLVELPDREEAAAQVRGGKLAAAAVVPEGFAEAAWTEQPLPLSIIATSYEPDDRVASDRLRSAATRLLGSVRAARLSLGQGEAADRAARERALGRALAEWKRPRASLASETYLPAGQMTGFQQSSPGMIVQFAIYGLISSAMILVMERKSRAMQRLLTTSASRAAIIAGHLGAMFLVIWVQEAALVACGQLAFGVNYLGAPGATLLMMSALALWSASLGLLVASLARNEQQVVMYSMIAMFLFSALGGAWFPLDVAGSGFARVGRLTPGAWAMDAFRGILLRGHELAAVLAPAGKLAACAAAFFGLALWRFRFE